MRRFASLAGLFALLWGAPAAAQRSPAAAPDWAFGAAGGEIAVAAVSVASLSTVLLPQRHSTWGAATSQDWDERLGLVSDFTGAFFGTTILAGGMYAFESAYLLDAGVPEPFGRALRTSLIDVEAVMLATGVTNVIKRLSGRCRPRAWHQGRCGRDDTDFDAFPSGHTAPVAAIAGVRLLLALRTPGDASLRLGAVSVAETATLVTMALRMGAGAHSWEDVGTGMIVGHVTGIALAALHPMIDLPPAAPGALSAPATGGTAFTWSGTF